MFSYFPLFSTGKKQRRLDARRWSRLTVGPLWQISGISSISYHPITVYMGDEDDYYYYYLFPCWIVRSSSFSGLFYCFIFCLTRPQIIKTAESNKTNARSSFLSPLTRSDAEQIDKYIMKQREKEILTAMIQFTLINVSGSQIEKQELT